MHLVGYDYNYDSFQVGLKQQQQHTVTGKRKVNIP